MKKKYGFKRYCVMRYSTQKPFTKKLKLGRSCWGRVIVRDKWSENPELPPGFKPLNPCVQGRDVIAQKSQRSLYVFSCGSHVVDLNGWD